MSLQSYCTSCRDNCCKGKTIISAPERDDLLSNRSRDPFLRWSSNIYYLERGPCVFHENGRCAVQALKPFVCRIFPFVPRVAFGTWWLFLVSECPAAIALDSEFVARALSLARATLQCWNLQDYASYWSANKVGDFDEERVLWRVPVFPEVLINNLKEELGMKAPKNMIVPGCVGTTVEMVGEGTGFQVLRVSVADGGEIPIHAHECAATMVILEGTARTLGKDGRHVKAGDVVTKAAREPHGFTDATGSFAFLSVSTGVGILNGGSWDLKYA